MSAAITVRGLRKSYGTTVAADGIDLDVIEGEVLGILGPNGSGKTTTVECIAGLRRPDAGTVRVLGHDPSEREEFTRLVGVQLQAAGLPAKLSVREALELYGSFYDDPLDGVALAERMGLAGKLDSWHRDLSGGQQQRLAICLALVGRPRVALLDELTTGLDPRSRRVVWEVIAEMASEGVTVVLVTHLMEEAQHLCDRIAVIDGGRVVALDSTAGIVESSAAPTCMAFSPSKPVEMAELGAIVGVAGLSASGGRIELRLSDEAVLEVLDHLRATDVVPRRLRVVESTLDEAFVRLVASGEAPEESP